MQPPKDSLLLIDGHAVLYRAFHALPPLKTKEGIPTNAVYGFITTLFKAIEDIKPHYCAVAFDVAGPTFRHKAYAGYKASRPDTPPELLEQVPYAYEVVKALNIPIFTAEGYEADDVIGSLSAQAKKFGTPVVIVTGDKDSFQLVDDNTFVYIMRRNITDTTLYDRDGVKERLGVLPEQVPDFKALAGDASDEIPGIAGIGEKTAVILLHHAHSIDGLYATLKKNEPLTGVSERIRQKVLDGEEIAKQSRSLAEIDRTVSIALQLEACKIHDYDPEEVSKVFQKLEFYSLLKRLPEITHGSVPVKQERDWDLSILKTKRSIEQTAQLLMHEPYLSVDTETDGLGGSVIGLSLSADENNGYYIPLIPEHGATLSPNEIADLLKPLLESDSVGKVGHNIKYDMASLNQLGIEVGPIAFDTMIAAYILHAHLRSFDLDSVSQRELGYTLISYAEAAGSTKKSASLKQANGEKVAEYAAEDAIIAFRLFRHFEGQLAKEPRLKHVAETIDFPLIPVLKRMEERGICIDTKKLKQLEADLDKEITLTRSRIESHATTPININSPAQLQKLLFQDLQLERQGIKATQNGLSTAAQELEKLQGQHPIIDDIMRYRELTKLQSTYVQTLPNLVDAEGRLHTKYSQTTAATGRLSSSDPNLQNIPIRTDLGNEIRKAFIAPKGWKLLSLDYSQIELRIIAHLSGDRNLKQVFIDGRDIHNEVAKQLGIDRRAAKAINFGIFYGLSPYGLSQGLKIDQKLAKQYIEAYLQTYSQVAEYIESTKKQVREVGYVETVSGRRREIPEIKASSGIIRAAAERMAINAPVQGTQADLIKLAMIEADNWIQSTYDGQKERPYLLLQVHDELLLEIPEALIPETAQQIKSIMEQMIELSIPIQTEAKVGSNWGEMEELAL